MGKRQCNLKKELHCQGWSLPPSQKSWKVHLCWRGWLQNPQMCLEMAFACLANLFKGSKIKRVTYQSLASFRLSLLKTNFNFTSHYSRLLNCLCRFTACSLILPLKLCCNHQSVSKSLYCLLSFVGVKTGGHSMHAHQYLEYLALLNLFLFWKYIK